MSTQYEGDMSRINPEEDEIDEFLPTMRSIDAVR